MILTLSTTLHIQQLEPSFGISGSCIEWISSYLSNRSSVVSINNSHSTSYFLPFGILQDSVLGPLLFIPHSSKLPRISSSFFLQSQLYADDSYILTLFPNNELSSAISEIPSCIGKIISWIDPMFFKLNPSKNSVQVSGFARACMAVTLIFFV